MAAARAGPGRGRHGLGRLAAAAALLPCSSAFLFREVADTFLVSDLINPTTPNSTRKSPAFHKADMTMSQHIQGDVEPVAALGPMGFAPPAVSINSDMTAAARQDPRQNDRVHAFIKAFFVVGVAELFDKTWFMSLILALKFGWRVALIGGYLGLVLHCVLSALLGFGFSHLLKPSILHFITAGLFFFFTLLYAKDCYFADKDSDLIASGKEEAEEAIPDGEGDVSGESDVIKPGAENLEGSFDAEKAKKPKNTRFINGALFQSFLAIFIAEWGDRTQMAMIGLHSSLPVFPVFFGSAAAFLVLTASAIVVATFIARASLSERLVMGTASVSFLVFAFLALKDGLDSKAKGH